MARLREPHPHEYTWEPPSNIPPNYERTLLTESSGGTRHGCGDNTSTAGAAFDNTCFRTEWHVHVLYNG